MKNFEKTIELLIGDLGKIRYDVVKDSYFESGLVFNHAAVTFTFMKDSDREKYRKILKQIKNRKNLYIYFENSDYYGACVGIIPISQADDFEFMNKKQMECVGKFEIMYHELCITGATEPEKLEKVNAFHRKNQEDFRSELSARHEKILSIA